METTALAVTALVAVVAAVSGDPPSPSYDPVNIWPMPTVLQLCGSDDREGGSSGTRATNQSAGHSGASGQHAGANGGVCVGPHAVPRTANVSVRIGTGCDSAAGDDVLLTALAHEALSLGTVFRSSPRTYDESPYAASDAWCLERCSQDSDCGFVQQCYIPANRRWSTKTGCAPSSKYATGCGCCVPRQRDGGAGTGYEQSLVLQEISSISVQCDTHAAADAGVADANGSYTVDVSSNGIAVTATSSTGAAHGLATVAQLLRWDSDLQTHVVDFVPMRIQDSPRFSWRGYMLDTSRHVPVLARRLPLAQQRGGQSEIHG